MKKSENGTGIGGCFSSNADRPERFATRKFAAYSRVLLVGAFFLSWASRAPIRASEDDAVKQAMQDDIILRAIVDELDRGRDGLVLADLPRPYFMEYCLTDLWMGQASAELGTLVRSHASRSRRLRCDVRVGSHELDNTNFRGGPGGSGGAGDAPLPLDFDYDVIRQSLWWAADRTYKSAVETLEAKKAFMEGKVIEDKPNDFSRESPVVFLEDRIELAGEPQDLETLVLDASSVFRGFPEVQDSSVSVQSGRGHKYLVNNEGTRIRTAHVWWWISAAATVQAEDGMSISDSLTYYVRRKEDLPTSEELRNEARAMAARLIAVRTAPKLEHYSGPVLFDAPAAAGLFARTFALRLPGGQRPVGSRASPDDFANKIGKRVLPRFLNIVDDPTREEIEGTTVIGRYRYDDQGVPAAPTTLVEKGRLVAQLMSRNPSREFPRSTGHGRGVLAPRPSIGCLIVSSESGLDEASMKEEFLEAVSDEGLEFGVRVSSLGIVGGVGDGGGSLNPLLMFKVFPDGREELVRGAEMARIDLKTFKRIVAAGNRPFVLNSAGAAGYTIAVPAILFEEIDLATIDRDFDKPPILPSPLARAAASKD